VHHANISLSLHSLDPMNEGPELEVQAKQVQAEETNPEPEQGKPRCIIPNPWILYFDYYLMLRMIVHYVGMSWLEP
jgi:hypothetical protein